MCEHLFAMTFVSLYVNMTLGESATMIMVESCLHAVYAEGFV